MKSRTYISLLLIFALFAGGVMSLRAVSKSARQAEKLAGNFSKIDEARTKVAEALADSASAADPYTLYVAGKVEEGAFKHYSKLLGINRNDPKVDRTVMADALLKALSYYEQSMSHDTVINKKGKAETRYSERIAEWLNSVIPSLYNAGVAYMNKRMYYPQAYNAFKAYAEAPVKYYYRPGDTPMTDSVQANAWFYAGVMAYNAEQYDLAADAFDTSRKLGYPRKEVWLNEMSCLSHKAMADSTLTDSLSRRITALAAEGHARFGLSTPLFIKKYVAGLMYEEKTDSALNVVDKALVEKPDDSMLHAMRAALLQSKSDLVAACDAYLVAAAYENADFDTLKQGSKTIAKHALELLKQVQGNRKAAKERREQIKTQYLVPALDFARRASSINPSDTDVKNTIETIDYYLH